MILKHRKLQARIIIYLLKNVICMFSLPEFLLYRVYSLERLYYNIFNISIAIYIIISHSNVKTGCKAYLTKKTVNFITRISFYEIYIG